MLAHELRNPLTVIQASVDLLTARGDELDPGADARQTGLVDVPHSGAPDGRSAGNGSQPRGAPPRRSPIAATTCCDWTGW